MYRGKEKLLQEVLVAATNLFNLNEQDNLSVRRSRRSELSDALGRYFDFKGFFVNCNDTWHTEEICPSFSCPSCEQTGKTKVKSKIKRLRLL